MADLAASFRAAFGHDPEVAWRAPGRVNLIGEHTDYNDGFVLPLAVPFEVRVLAARRDDRALRVASLQEPDGTTEVVADVEALRPGDVGGWAAYVAGTAWALGERGVSVPGADLLVDGDVPQGAGLSSSAALECATAGALLALGGDSLPSAEVALAAQHAENDFVGMPCGVMDQFASTHCTADHALFLDTRTLDARQVPLPLAEHGLVLLVVDTRAPHRLVDGEYAARRAQCERAAALLDLAALRDLSEEGLPAALERLDDEVLRRRVRHVVTEDARVLATVALLDAGDVRGIGPLMTASHASLRDDYEVSCPELDVAVDAALSAGALGARMTGGGFGGSAIALVDAASADAVAEAAVAAYAERGFAPPRVFPVLPSPGSAPLPLTR
ncbi:MAG: galactokinase [Candidatus Nanopelagicales bacterium]